MLKVYASCSSGAEKRKKEKARWSYFPTGWMYGQVCKPKKKKKKDEVTFQLVGCMDKFVKKSRIEKVAEVKNFQDPSSIIAY